MNNKFIVGTRGSKLAVSQTKLLLHELEKANPGVEFEIKTIKTSGDFGMLEQFGAFTKEVETELYNKTIDLAVHSLKDMPTKLPEGLVVACVPLRGEHRDCLISKNHIQLHELPQGAKVGTSSLRRVYQLRKMRPDLNIIPMHGNIITRMERVEHGEFDAIILALAGLQRVGMEYKASQVFETDEMLSAVSQGALAIEIREGDERTREMVSKITDKKTELAVEAERSFLMALGGGCRMPIAAFAKVNDEQILIDGLYCSAEGDWMQKASISGKPEEASALGKQLAEGLLTKFKNRE